MSGSEQASNPWAVSSYDVARALQVLILEFPLGFGILDESSAVFEMITAIRS